MHSAAHVGAFAELPRLHASLCALVQPRLDLLVGHAIELVDDLVLTPLDEHPELFAEQLESAVRGGAVIDVGAGRVSGSVDDRPRLHGAFDVLAQPFDHPFFVDGGALNGQLGSFGIDLLAFLQDFGDALTDTGTLTFEQSGRALSSARLSKSRVNVSLISRLAFS